MSNVTIVIYLFVPFRYLQFLKIVRPTSQPASQPAEKKPCKVCPLSAYRSPRSTKLGAVSTDFEKQQQEQQQAVIEIRTNLEAGVKEAEAKAAADAAALGAAYSFVKFLCLILLLS